MTGRTALATGRARSSSRRTLAERGRVSWRDGAGCRLHDRPAADSQKSPCRVAKEGVEIARVTDPGAVFGEISALLDQPHSADVRALTSSQFHVADAAALLQDPAVLLYVSAILARRLDGANQTLVELMIQVDYPRKMIEKTAKKMKGLLGASGVHLPYAGYNLFN